MTYRRGVEEATVTVEFGQVAFRSELEGGVRVEIGECDALIKTADLPFDEPREGDRIIRTLSEELMAFRVTTPENGEPAWRWSGTHREKVRLHLKKVPT